MAAYLQHLNLPEGWSAKYKAILLEEELSEQVRIRARCPQPVLTFCAPSEALRPPSVSD
jgi:hypothetical protein